MKYLGKITDPKDLVTKEYVDNNVSDIIPSQGSVGDILTKTGANAISWITPADDFTGDNTRPATANLVNTQIGNINALLATI